MKRLYLVVFFLFLFSFHFSALASAHHKRDVLGVATVPSDVTFPAVTSGPGFILPDNPFYFLDKWVQGIRLATAFDTDRKVAIRNQIAGERLAELRIMMARNSEKGIGIVLSEMKTESAVAAKNVTDAKAQGKDVTELAKSVNETMKSQQAVLNDLAIQTDGSLELAFRSAKEAIREAKVSVEDELPQDELEKEIEDALHNELEENLHAAAGSVRGVEHAIDVLTKLASQAAERNQKSREEALRRAIEVKSDVVRVEAEKMIEAEIRKDDKISDATQKEREAVKEIVRQALEAERKMMEAKRLREELAKKPAVEFLTPTAAIRKPGSVAGSTSQKAIPTVPTQNNVR